MAKIDENGGIAMSGAKRRKLHCQKNTPLYRAVDGEQLFLTPHKKLDAA
jgi:hypothetical protein